MPAERRPLTSSRQQRALIRMLVRMQADGRLTVADVSAACRAEDLTVAEAGRLAEDVASAVRVVVLVHPDMSLPFHAGPGGVAGRVRGTRRRRAS